MEITSRISFGENLSVILPTKICENDAMAYTTPASKPVIATDVEILDREVSKYLGIIKVIVPKINPALKVDKPIELNALNQFLAKGWSKFFLVAVLLPRSIFNAYKNLSTYKMQKTPGNKKHSLQFP